MLTRNYTYRKCEDCRKHGRCKREQTAFKWWQIKGCMVELTIESPRKMQNLQCCIGIGQQKQKK